MSLKLPPNPLDKDPGENVAPIVVRSIQALSTNFGYVKNWANKQEDSLKLAHEHQKALEARLDSTDIALRQTQARLDNVAANVQAVADGRRADMESITGCLNHLLRSTTTLIERIAGTFRADIATFAEASEDGAAADGISEAVVDGVPAAGRISSRSGGGGSNASCGGAVTPPVFVGEEIRISALSMDAFPEPPADHFHAMGIGLDASLVVLQRALGLWVQRREAERDTRDALYTTAEELRLSSERTRERLLAWRDMLKESSHVVDCLATSLAQTQGAVAELQASQVLKRDVEEAVNARGKQLEELNDSTSRRMDDLVETMEERSKELDRSLREAQRLTGERIAEHAAKVAQMVERNVNPINAYLNTMHVKSDAFRAELDKLNSWSPTVDANLTEFAERLAAIDDAHSGRAQELAGHLERISGEAADRGKHRDGRFGDLENTVGALKERLVSEVATLREALSAATNDLGDLRRGDVTSLAQELRNLEQKVAKWVHAHPLPAKISEARLFALEARLADECDARLGIERQIGLRPTPRGQALRGGGGSGGGGEALPQLPPQSWSGGEAAGRSAMYDAYRFQAASQRMPKA